MCKDFIIVESPTKAKTLNKFLKGKYYIDASMGHIRDLPEKQYGIQIEDDEFIPKYVISMKSRKVVKRLKDIAKKSNKIYLATDPDREGEAIAWHIYEILKPINSKIERIEFHEITKTAILKAIENSDDININRVNAQQARRILDRMVGYKLSPILWRVLAKGLSAGRVQSVAVKLICEREEIIEQFVPEEYWKMKIVLCSESKDLIEFELNKIDGKKAVIPDEKTAEKISDEVRNSEFKIKRIVNKKTKKNSLPPLTTSKLQQMASNKYNFSTSKTMRVAQQLYEGIAVTSSETMGLITYMRTDSTRVAKEAQEMAAEYILNNFGKEYLSENPNRFKQKNKNVQDAHEAIRPTQVIRTPESLRKVLTPDQYKLYKIIWEIFVASQMSAAVFDTRTILVNSGKYEFSVKGSVKLFDGFTKVSFRDNKDIILPDFKETEQFEFNSLEKTQNFTKPPARFTEATLVKELEEKGIGRPSTYATIVSTIINRKYIDKIERNLKPTYLGREVNDFLNLKFDNIIEVGFTADMEANLDKIENEGENWQNILKDFYVKFENDISLIMKNIKEIKKNMVKYTKFDCEKCGSKLVLKITPKGKFAACPNYPKCKNIKNVEINEDNEIKILEDEVLEENCPDCGKPLMLKRGKFGEFIACSNYPKCKFRKQKELDISCPKDGCDGKIVLRTIRKGRKFGKKFYGCSKYPDCDFVSWNEPVNKECPLCKSSYLVVSKKKKDVIELKCPDKNCSYTEQQTIDE